MLLHERGIDISHETVRFWWDRFGPVFAAEIRRKRVNRMRAILTGSGTRTKFLWRSMVRDTTSGGRWITKARCWNLTLRSAEIVKRH